MKKLKNQSVSTYTELPEEERFINQFKGLADGEQFIAVTDTGIEFSAVKVDDECGAIVNCDNEFVPFWVHNNCWDIGGGMVHTFRDFDAQKIKEAATAGRKSQEFSQSYYISNERKPRTSSAVKNRYNQKVYGDILVKLPKDLVTRFKEKCAEEGISQAQVIKAAVEDFLEK